MTKTELLPHGAAQLLGSVFISEIILNVKRKTVQAYTAFYCTTSNVIYVMDPTYVPNEM